MKQCTNFVLEKCWLDKALTVHLLYFIYSGPQKWAWKSSILYKAVTTMFLNIFYFDHFQPMLAANSIVLPRFRYWTPCKITVCRPHQLEDLIIILNWPFPADEGGKYWFYTVFYTRKNYCLQPASAGNSQLRIRSILWFLFSYFWMFILVLKFKKCYQIHTSCDAALKAPFWLGSVDRWGCLYHVTQQ